MTGREALAERARLQRLLSRATTDDHRTAIATKLIALARTHPAALMPLILSEQGRPIIPYAFQADWFDHFLSNEKALLLAARGHGKSLIMVTLAAWLVGNNPYLQFAMVVGKHNLVKDRTDMLAAILKHPRYREVFPNVPPLITENEDTLDLGLTPGYPTWYALTILAAKSAPGKHVDVLLLDDCITDENACTESKRQEVAQIYGGTIRPYLRDASPYHWTIGTPWHTDDLYHFMQASGEFATRIDPVETDGVFLLHSPEWLARERASNPMSEDMFQLQYYCRITEKHGEVFHREWFPITDSLPRRPDGTLAIGGMAWCWDTAGTEGAGDYSCGMLVARTDDGDILIVDVIHGQWEPTNLIREITTAWHRSVERYGPAVCELLIEETPAAKALLPGLFAHASGLKSRTRLLPHGGKSKTERVDRVLYFCECRRCRFLRADWNRPLLDELVSFTRDGRQKHDDQTDTLAYAIYHGSGMAAFDQKQKTTQTTRTMRTTPVTH